MERTPHSATARRAALLLASAALVGCASESGSGQAASGQAALFKSEVGDIAGGVAPGPHASWYVDAHPQALWKDGVATWRPDSQSRESAFSRWVARFAGHRGPTQLAVLDSESGLPVPSVVEVTNLATGATVEVRVEDRAQIGGALINLSPELAKPLGVEPGQPLSVRVRYHAPVIAWREQPTLEYALRGRLNPTIPQETQLAAQTQPAPPFAMAPAAPAPLAPAMLVKADLPAAAPHALAPAVAEPVPASVAPPPAPPVHAEGASETHVFRVQAGAFASLDNAHRAMSMVAAAGEASLQPVKHGARTLYRVIVTGHPSETGEALRAKVAQAGFADARVLKPS